MDLFKGFLKVDGDSHLRVFNYQINITRNARCGEQKHELVNLHNLAKYHRNLIKSSYFGFLYMMSRRINWFCNKQGKRNAQSCLTKRDILS